MSHMELYEWCKVTKIMENFHHEIRFLMMLDFIVLRDYMFWKLFYFNNEMLITFHPIGSKHVITS
jgi:hypothetical protein